MRAKNYLTFFLLTQVLFPGALMAQRVVWWNVENLFDTRHDSLKNDLEFLPEGSNHWTPPRYWRKLDNVSRTLAALALEGDEWPALVGLAEVENDSVLRDLTKRSPLCVAGYNYVLHEGSDVRGIDVAVLYQPSAFRLLYSEGIRVPLAERGFRPTRDILHVVGVQPQADTLHILAVHLPSRAGSGKRGTKSRLLAVQTLCSVLDSLSGKRLLLMGDFNAEPDDKIFRQIRPRLVSLMPQRKNELKKACGTYFFQERWSYLDHILLSRSLSREMESRAQVAAFGFLLDENGAPERTFRGPSYIGGFSDHLPLYVDWKK